MNSIITFIIHYPWSCFTVAAILLFCFVSLVRIGEFAWSRYEPRRGEFDWGWLDRAIDVLGAAGLKVEFSHAIALRIAHPVTEDGRSVRALVGTTQQVGEARAVEDVVA